MTDSSEKLVEGGDGAEAEVAASAARVAWVKVGKIWWPGQVLSEDEMTDEMRREVTGKKSRKSKGNSDIYVVKFFNEDEYEVVGKPSDIILSPDDEKKFDLVKRAISQMKSTTLAENRPKFKQDVLHAERLLDPSSDLTTITKLLDGESLEPKKAKYADIFPTVKPEKPSPAPAASTPGAKGKAGAVKFNFPSSRIINSASSKPPSKIAPLPSDPSKKYHCNFCGYSSDRVNVITDHMKFCKAKSPATNSPLASSSANSNKQKVTTAAATPSRKVEMPVIKPVAGTSPVKKPAARTPRVATPKTAATPMVKSPVKVAASSVATSSITATPIAVGGVRGKTGKKVRRSKKDKMRSDKQKAEILQDWNDSSSEGEDDSDDELDMPPSKPPELFLFGSERNKKRKAEGGAPELDDVKVENGEGSKGGSVSVENGADGKPVVVDEDQPPVLKKPRTDKELSDAFEALLRTTKPEHDKLLGKVTGEDGDEKMEVEEEEEEEENNHLSDIEEDAMIVMKKVDVDDKEENKAENKKGEEEKEMEVEVVEEKKEEKEVEKKVEKEAENKTEKEVEVEPPAPKKKVEEEKPLVREGRRSTRRSRALVAEEEEELAANKAKEIVEKAKIAAEEKIEKEKQEKKVEEEKKKKNEKDAEDKKKKSEKEEVREEVEVSTPAVSTRTSRRSRRASKPEEVNKVVEEVVKETLAPPFPVTPVVAKGGRRGLRGSAAAAAVENKAVEEVKKAVDEVEVEEKKEEKEEKEVKKEEPVVAAAAVAKPVATLTPTLASTRSRRGTKLVPPSPSVVEPVKEKEAVIEKPQQAVKSQVKSTPSKVEKEQEKVDKKVVEEPVKVDDKVKDAIVEPESVAVNQVVVQDVEIAEPKITAPVVKVKTPKSSPAISEEKKSEPVPVPEPAVAEVVAEKVEKVAEKGQLATQPPPPPVVVQPPKASPKKAEVSQVTASKSKPAPPPPPTLAVAPSESTVVVSPSKALGDSAPSPVKKAPTPVKESTPKSPAKSVVKPTPTEKPTPVPPPKPVQSPQKTKVTTPATTAVPPTSPQKVEQKSSSPARPTPKPTGVTTGVEQKPQVAAAPSVSTPPAPVATPSLPPPPPTVVAPPPPPTVVAPAPVSPPKAQPQKKPTAAVRPLVDTKEPPKEISSAPSTVKDRKGNSTAAQSKSAAAPTSKEIPVSQQPPSVVQSSSQPVQQQGQQQSQQTISVEGEVAVADGKQSPALVAQRVVHLVPVENADGTITYMLLSLENGSENPSVVLEQGAENAGTVLRLDKVEPMDTSQGGEGTSPHANLPMNPNEVEGIFLDKSVESANQIVSAIVSATGNATSTTSILENSTAYVTLAMDASALGASNSDTASVATSLSGQSTIVIPEGATMSTAAGGGQVVDGDPVTQQVFYMTEDGALVDPQSLGLTYEQLQVLLNQSS